MAIFPAEPTTIFAHWFSSSRSPKSSIIILYHEVLNHPLFSRHHRALFVVVVVVVRRGVRPSSASGRIRIIISPTTHVQEAGRHPRHRGRHRRRQGGRIGVRGRDSALRERYVRPDML